MTGAWWSRTRRIALVVVVCSWWTLPARAQSPPYIAVSVGGDILRSDYTQSGTIRYASGDGEVLDVALRAGTGIVSVLGVEAEFSRSARTDSTGPPGPIPLAASTSSSAVGYTISSSVLSFVDLASPLAPTFFSPSTSRQVTSLNVLASLRQAAGTRIRLLYMAGISFSRQTIDSSYSILPAAAIVMPRFRNRTVDYGVDPIVGVDAHITLTTHASVIPGIRLQSLGDGWLVRPGIGLGWNF